MTDSGIEGQWCAVWMHLVIQLFLGLASIVLRMATGVFLNLTHLGSDQQLGTVVVSVKGGSVTGTAVHTLGRGLDLATSCSFTGYIRIIEASPWQRGFVSL